MSIYGTGFYKTTFDILPQQMIPLKEKLKAPTDDEKSWGQKCMDALETLGKEQYRQNLKLIENYEMVKGRFIFSHYFQTEGYSSMLNQLTAEFELPNYLRHYDIISQVINTLSGEWQKRPDLFKVRQMGDGAANEYLRTKVDMTTRYVLGKVNAEISRRLIERGVDVTRTDFDSEEEAQQYGQQIEQARKEMTPLEIQRFMDTDFQTQAEIWGQHQMALNKELFNYSEIEKTEFEDMLVADRCFRHFYLTPTGRSEETWNPINTFFHKSPDVTHIEDGDYAGRIFHLSMNSIIDRYGFLMKKADFDLLENRNQKDNTKWSDSKYNWVYNQYLVPFKDYPAYDMMKSSWNKAPGTESGNIPYLDQEFNGQINDDSFYRDREGFFFVTETYWKTQKKLIKVTYIDSELQTKVVKLVDENFIIPTDFLESKTPFADDQDINTYVETHINEVWKGIKINTGVDKNLNKDLYLAIGPNEFQFKGDQNIYGCKLPVCGQIFSVRNSRSMALVDMMKPHQIGHNVAMNQLYQLAEKEVGVFAVMDVNMFPNSKDWGGEDTWGKWMLMAKSLGMVPADTSPENIRGSLAATGGQLPKILDLNLGAQMVSRMNMAQFFEQQALKQVGFNQYRLGSFAQTSTATGIEEGQKASYTSTESYFTNFSNYLRRCHQMGLDMDQYVQSQKEDITFTYIKSDLQRAYVKVMGIDLLLANIGIFVSNSQEHARQLEMLRTFALENNTAGMSPVDVADVIMMNSPAEIRRQLDNSYKQLLGNQQQQQQLQQQQLEQEKQLRTMELEQTEIDKQKDRENKLDVAKIQAGVDILNSIEPDAVNNAADAEKTALAKDTATNATNIQRERLNLDRQKAIADAEFKNKELAIKQAKISADLQIQNQETETVRIQHAAQAKEKAKAKKTKA